MKKKMNRIVAKLEQKGHFKLAKELSDTSAASPKGRWRKALLNFQKSLEQDAKKLDVKVMKFINAQRKAAGRKPYVGDIDYYVSFVPHAESIDIYEGMNNMIEEEDDEED